MLSERQNKILKLIVEEYIEKVKPISSNRICSKLKCSSATIRNEMAFLDDMGFLEKSHFASGRIPSENGYKYYVNNLMKPKAMNGEDMMKLQTIFQNQTLDLNDTIKRSLEIIAEITNYTTIVLGKKSWENKLKKVEVVPLEKGKILTIVITDHGHVEYKNLHLPENILAEEVSYMVNLINKLLIGTPINEISQKLEFDIKPIIGKYVKQHEVLYNTFYDAFNEFSNRTNDVHFEGKNNLLKQPEFNNIEKIKEILNKFEEDTIITPMEDKENGINIYIGSESEITEDMAVIKTKYNLGGEEFTFAIVGPKRMEYDRVVSLLNYIKENLEEEI